MKAIKVALLISFMVCTVESVSYAGWLVYHESALKGTILDIDTKQPIEGAVVAAVYRKSTMGLGAGSESSVINARETLTDKKGNFVIPSYWTLIQPFSWQISTRIIILKPGYASLELVGSTHFAGEELQQEQYGSWWWAQYLKYGLRGRGIVELPKVMTKEERTHAWMTIDIFPTTFNIEKELPALHKMIDEESKIWRYPS